MHSDQPHYPSGPSDPSDPTDPCRPLEPPAPDPRVLPDRSGPSGPLNSPGPADPPTEPDPLPLGAQDPTGFPRPRLPGDGEPADPPTAGALTLTDPNDIIATLPYVVGEPPDPGVVILTVRGKGVCSVFCGDLDRLRASVAPDRYAGPPLDTAVAEGSTGVVVVAYGPPEQVTPYVDGLLAAARERELAVIDALRVTEGRYWSYVCMNPECCPVEGTAVNADRSAVPANAVLYGIPPAQPFHATLADLARVRAVLEPDPRTRARAETADGVVAEHARRLVQEGGEDVLADRGVPAALAAVRGELAGAGVTDEEELAWLGVYLTDLRVRDAVWARITEESAEAHQQLWSRVVQHVPERNWPAPAALLGVAAWQRNDLALARAALDHALAADPGYSMALLMSRALSLGFPVERWREFVAHWVAGQVEWPEEE